MKLINPISVPIQGENGPLGAIPMVESFIQVKVGLNYLSRNQYSLDFSKHKGTVKIFTRRDRFKSLEKVDLHVHEGVSVHCHEYPLFKLRLK